MLLTQHQLFLFYNSNYSYSISMFCGASGKKKKNKNQSWAFSNKSENVSKRIHNHIRQPKLLVGANVIAVSDHEY